jgi:hypothetical protein
MEAMGYLYVFRRPAVIAMFTITFGGKEAVKSHDLKVVVFLEAEAGEVMDEP